jgi:rRNA maturation endonuclease Nob1
MQIVELKETVPGCTRLFVAMLQCEYCNKVVKDYCQETVDHVKCPSCGKRTRDEANKSNS